MIETDVERYADIKEFAREVNLPLLGRAGLEPVPAGASISRLLSVEAPEALKPVVDGLAEARQSLTLRALLLAGFADDTTCFAAGLALGREWSRRGLRVAVVDLDFRSPTVVRPGPHPNEGIVDVLDYGCSFRRVAWELSAGSLWVIGPGSHPPDRERLAEHPDWDRAARGFTAHVDVAIYVAPLLDLRGYVGRLSKRMDGVLLAASAERVGRAELRDAFLELWGSDAPIIGCVELEGPAAEALPREPAPARVAEGVPAASSAGAPSWVSPAPAAPAASLRPPASPPADREPAPGFANTEEPSHRGQAAEATEPGSQPGRYVEQPEQPDHPAHDEELTAELDREVRFGRGPVVVRRRSRAGLAAGVVAGLAVAASITLVLVRNPQLPPGAAEREVLPAGNEPVLPAAPEPSLKSSLGEGAPSPLPDVAGTPQPAGTAVSPAAGTPGWPDAGAVPTEAIPPSAAVEGKPFRVHVASFRSEAKVQEIVRELRLRGAEAWFEPAPDAPGYYRVFVGHFATEAEARAHAKWLLDNRWVERAHAFPSTQR